MRFLKTKAILLILLFNSVHAYAGGSWIYIPEVTGRPIGYVESIAAEKDGTIWVSSTKGLFRYKDNQWSDETEHFLDAYVIVVAPDGDVWFSGYPDSLARFDGENWHYYYYEEATTRLNDIDVDTNGIVWCSTGIGVFRFDGSTWEHYTIQDGLRRKGVQYISVSPDGVPWVIYGQVYSYHRQNNAGVSRLTGKTWETFDTDTGLPSNKVDDIAFGPDGSVFISYGTDNDFTHGIVRFNGYSWESFSDTFTGKMVFDSEGTLWVQKGLPWPGYIVTYNGATWEYYAEIVLPSDTVVPWGSMVIDSNGHIWLGTNKGVLVFTTTTGINDEYTQEPLEFNLLCNYPNPFNPSTTITFILLEPAFVNLNVYNATGQKVATLVDELRPAGINKIVFNGVEMPSGLYFAWLDANRVAITHKMLLIK